MKVATIRHGMTITPPPAADERRRTIQEVATHYTTHRSQVEKWVALGCPALNLAGPGAHKRLLRFDLAAVDAWLRRRS